VPVMYCWDNAERKAICYSYEGRWTWKELYTVLEESRQLWSEVDHSIDVIVDFTQSAGFPPGNILGHLYNVSTYYSSVKAVNTAVIGANDYFRMASEVFNQVNIRQRHRSSGHRKKAINKS
jgi:hypothetical protein